MSKIKIIPVLLLSIVSIICFGLFIYPGIYKYDKLNQKYPVKINRFTGNTQVLYPDGWADMSGYDTAETRMEQYKKEIEESISKQDERIRSSVLADIESELESIKVNYSSQTDEQLNFDAIRNRYENTNGTNSNEENSYFKKGDTTESVEKVMGTPDSIIGSELFEIWGYGNSSVSFSKGKVSGWSNTDNNLRIK
ncbi:hypothetical protein FHR92_005165 [Fontibacillus solani]|uniref:Uncharacterized protein n=1 Tax=Fontibacillus solani TaxID=1572857 RepID=A0A7W3SYN4_9BACL|nr:hypothetical protein [Fontibacillus solani]MBA9088647.1 hypothetical protein [Fontibacillus solani]